MSAQVRPVDAAAIEQRLDVLADSVCGNDGRTREQCRADALGALPAAVVRELAGSARLTPLVIPDPDAPLESGSRPSAGLAAFIRCRDVTCRFPGCDRPAEVCDIDHTVAYRRGGPTHPSNLKCLCR